MMRHIVNWAELPRQALLWQSSSLAPWGLGLNAERWMPKVFSVAVAFIQNNIVPDVFLIKPIVYNQTSFKISSRNLKILKFWDISREYLAAQRVIKSKFRSDRIRQIREDAKGQTMASAAPVHSPHSALAWPGPLGFQNIINPKS